MKLFNSTLAVICAMCLIAIVFASMPVLDLIIVSAVAFLCGLKLYISYKKLGPEEFDKTIIFSSFINE